MLPQWSSPERILPKGDWGTVVGLRPGGGCGEAKERKPESGRKPRIIMCEEKSDDDVGFWGIQTFGIAAPHWKKKSFLGPHNKYTNTNENK